MLPDSPDDSNGYYFIVHQLAQWRPIQYYSNNTVILNSNLPSGKSMHVTNRYCIFKPVTPQRISRFFCRSTDWMISSWASKGLNMLTWEKCRYFLSMSSSKIVMEPKPIPVALKMSFMRKSITWKNKISTLYGLCRCHFQISLSRCRS